MVLSPTLPRIAVLPTVEGHETPELVRWPHRFGQESFYRAAYPLMFLSRRLEERLLELFQKGYVKGTVASSIGNEATALGMSMPLRPGRDVVSLLHRDLVGHLLMGSHSLPAPLPIPGQRRKPDTRLRGQCSSWRRGRAADSP